MICNDVEWNKLWQDNHDRKKIRNHCHKRRP
jgi:hypothetical protein